MPSRLHWGVWAETSTWASTPKLRAASATPRPWLPAEAAMIRFLPAWHIPATNAAAPRSLNEPVRCSDSSLSHTSAPYDVPARAPESAASHAPVCAPARRWRPRHLGPDIGVEQAHGVAARYQRGPQNAMCLRAFCRQGGTPRSMFDVDIARLVRSGPGGSKPGRPGALAVERDPPPQARQERLVPPTTTRSPRYRPSPTPSAIPLSWPCAPAT